jgi:hypothetical protein
MASKAPWIAAAVCLYAAAFAIYAPLVSDHPFAYDEADYMWAGKQGFFANYTDLHGLSFGEFIRKGIELANDSSKREAYSEYIRSSGDLGFYRHYHGAVYDYWIAILHDLGFTSERAFRGSGLLINFASATLLLFGFWYVFPALPRLAGLVACALFVFNPTALTASMFITLHGMFTFFCIATLLAASMFFRSLEPRWFYATMAALGAAFCTLETSSLLVVTLALAMLVEHKRLRERWTLKGLGALLAKGIGFFVLAAFVCWPAGLGKLGMAKGFMALAYMSLKRKVYNGQGTLYLWSVRFNASPWEFALLVAGTIVAFVLWRRSPYKRELVPWLAFIVVFLGITFRITLESTYYYAPLTAAFIVATSVAFGTLWQRSKTPWRLILPLAVVAGIAGMTVQYRANALAFRATRPYHIAVLQALNQHPVGPGQRLYLPYQLVPTLHYYHPEIATTGFDNDYPMARLADQVAAPNAAGFLLCEEDTCAALSRLSPGLGANKTLIDPAGPYGHPFYVMEVPKTGSL